MTGKEKCKMLKEIRAQIAAQNDIEFVTRECTHKGVCKGTCPKCESEVRYLEDQLEKKRASRKKVALAGISAGLMLSLTGCSAQDTIVETLDALWEKLHPSPLIDVLDGEIQVMGEESCFEPLSGDIQIGVPSKLVPPDTDEPLMGLVAPEKP